MVGIPWTTADDAALHHAVTDLSHAHNDPASLYTAVAFRISRETQKPRTRQTVSERHHLIMNAVPNPQPATLSKHNIMGNATSGLKSGILKPAKHVLAETKDGKKRRYEDSSEEEPPKKRDQKPFNSRDRFVKKQVAALEEAQKHAEPASPSRKANPRLPESQSQLTCSIAAIVGKVKNGEYYVFSLSVQGGGQPWHGVIYVRGSGVKQEIQEAWEQLSRSSEEEPSITVNGLSPTSCRVTKIEADGHNAYKCSLGIVLGSHECLGRCQVPAGDIDRNLLKQYLRGPKHGSPLAEPLEDEQSQNETTAGTQPHPAYPDVASLPTYQGVLDGGIQESSDPAFFTLPLTLKTPFGDRNGYCRVPTAEFSEKHRKAIRAGDAGPVSADDSRCEARLLEISEEDEEDYAVAIEVSRSDHEDEYRGAVTLSKREVGGELLEPWLAERGETIVASVEDGAESKVEQANKYNRTVSIIGNIPVGERRSTSLKVEVWSWDGTTSLQATAKVMERTKRDTGYRLRLKVKLADSAFMYLCGWVHEESFGGRFAEETPGVLVEE